MLAVQFCGAVSRRAFEAVHSVPGDIGLYQLSQTFVGIGSRIPATVS